jgi:hypothetical protein
MLTDNPHNKEVRVKRRIAATKTRLGPYWSLTRPATGRATT